MREDDLRQRAAEMFRDWFPRFTPLTPSSPGWLNPRQRGCQWGMGFSCGLRGHNLARRLLPGAKCRHARLPQQHMAGKLTPDCRSGARRIAAMGCAAKGRMPPRDCGREGLGWLPCGSVGCWGRTRERFAPSTWTITSTSSLSASSGEDPRPAASSVPGTGPLWSNLSSAHTAP